MRFRKRSRFGIYRERVGALFVKATEKSRPAVMSNLAAIARANYSMPPDHGAAIVREVLSDEALRASWRAELDQIRTHIKTHAPALGGGARQFDADASDRAIRKACSRHCR